MATNDKPSAAKKVKQVVKREAQRGARKDLIEELFYDFNRSKGEIFLVNFQRGFFFGIGSILGGAVLIVVSALLLGMFVDLPGGIGDFVQNILDAMNRRPVDS